jgi:hypothetical protein
MVPVRGGSVIDARKLSSSDAARRIEQIVSEN